MKKLVVLSGKGGTGKTTVSAALATLWQGEVLCVDADVDAANLHLVLQPINGPEVPFVGGRMPRLDEKRCNGCGKCTELCRFHAIVAGKVRQMFCEGCGLCALACPEQAPRMVDRVSGAWSVGVASCGPLLQARLLPGAGNSGKLVSLLKEEATRIVEREPVRWLLCDGPPGTGCPTMAALTGSDVLLAVTEPSAAGLHDLRRLLDLAAQFGIPAYACINKADIAPVFAREVADECQRRKVPLLARIPYDPGVSEYVRRGESVINHKHSPAAAALAELAKCLTEIMAPDGVEAATLPE